MINEWIMYIALTFVGILIGTFFYGGLYFTTKKGLISHQPALWFALSALIRIGISLSAFYLIAGYDWKRLIMCIAGFIISKPLVVRLVKELDGYSGFGNTVGNETE